MIRAAMLPAHLRRGTVATRPSRTDIEEAVVTSPARRASCVLAMLLALLVTGCTREFGPGETARGASGAPGANVDATTDAARTKLSLQVQDPCYAGDARQAWPRCARWVEETASSARTAAEASGSAPADPAVVAGAAAVAAGHDAFLGRGCGTGATGAQADAGACVGALTQTRNGVRGLAQALHVPGV
jgi:hypothetical protein